MPKGLLLAPPLFPGDPITSFTLDIARSQLVCGTASGCVQLWRVDHAFSLNDSVGDNVSANQSVTLLSRVNEEAIRSTHIDPNSGSITCVVGDVQARHWIGGVEHLQHSQQPLSQRWLIPHTFSSCQTSSVHNDRHFSILTSALETVNVMDLRSGRQLSLPVEFPRNATVSAAYIDAQSISERFDLESGKWEPIQLSARSSSVELIQLDKLAAHRDIPDDFFAILHASIARESQQLLVDFLSSMQVGKCSMSEWLQRNESSGCFFIWLENAEQKLVRISQFMDKKSSDDENGPHLTQKTLMFGSQHRNYWGFSLWRGTFGSRSYFSLTLFQRII